jgi:hypothetical protein
MQNVIETFGGVALFIGVGLLFLKIFARIVGGRDHEDAYLTLQSIYSTRQINRRDERVEIIEQIGSPECRDGTFSPRQKHLWDLYHSLEREDKKLTTQERSHLVEVRGYLPDEIADIIEGIER